MKNDTAAAEAALGLLGLSSQPHAADIRTISSAIVPLKRKSSVVFQDSVRERERMSPVVERERGRDFGKDNGAREREKEVVKARELDATTLDDEKDELPPPPPPPPSRPRASGKPKSRTKPPRSAADPLTIVTTTSSDDATDQIRCVCEISDDIGLSLACDKCGRWVHAACFDFESQRDVPEEWYCWVCVPRAVDKSKAVKSMRARQRAFAAQEAGRSRASGVDGQATEDRGQRKVSPGVERKPRRAIDGGNNARRKRRASLSTSVAAAHPSVHDEDEQIDIDEPSAPDYISIDTDIVPHRQTREMLRRAAHSWRGATALDSTSTTPVVLSPDAIPSSSSTTLRPISSSHHSGSSVRPPTYAVHTTHPIPSQSYIAPYTSTVTPSKQYLADPLNAYAHLSMPKPYVHLVGPPLDVALDARLAGRDTRYVRSGCRPNAVLRPVLCSKKKRGKQPQTTEEDEAESLSFAVFALRDLKANEEIVLGWEWDDGSVIHHLPALIDSPHLFAPLRFQQYRNQMTSMLHALSSTFTTCACGSTSRDCALARLAEFVEHPLNPHPPPRSYSSTSTTPVSPISPELPHDMRTPRDIDKVDLGPLIGKERGFRTREKVPLSGGMSGVEMVPTSMDEWIPPSKEHTSVKRTKKGKTRATQDSMDVDISPSPSPHTSSSRLHSSAPSVSGDPTVPPRLRKQWIREKAQALSNRSPSPDGMVVDGNAAKTEREDDVKNDDTLAMPPPPLPPLASTLTSGGSSSSPSQPTVVLPPSNRPTSPSTSFANLSLLSPAVRGTSSYFATALNPVSHPVFMHTVPVAPSAPNEAPATTPSAMELDEPARSMSVGEDDSSLLGEPLHRRPSPRPLVVQERQRQTSPAAASSSVPPSLPVLSPSNVPNIPSKASPSSVEHDTSADTVYLAKPKDVSPVPVDDYPMETDPQIVQPPDITLDPTKNDQRTPTPPPPSPLVPRELTPREPTPPPPPPKKKISMGDYLSRKREAKAVSPAVAVSPLAETEEQPVKHGSTGKDSPVSMSPEEPSQNDELGASPLIPNPSPSPPASQVVKSFDDFWLRRSSEAPGTSNIPGAKEVEVQPMPVADGSLGTSSEATPPLSTGLIGPSQLADEKLPPVFSGSVRRTQVKENDALDEDNTRYVNSPGLDFSLHAIKSLAEAYTQHRIQPLVSPRVNPAAPALSRQPSQEDGEILSPPPLKAPPLEPPRYPRSLASTWSGRFGTTSPAPTSSPSARRGPPTVSSSRTPPAYHHTPSANARPLPNAPRALRGVSQSGGNASTLSVYSGSNASPPSRPLGPPLPRGPSMDRNRDWDRDRARDRVRSSTGGWHGSR